MDNRNQRDYFSELLCKEYHIADTLENRAKADRLLSDIKNGDTSVFPPSLMVVSWSAPNAPDDFAPIPPPNLADMCAMHEHELRVRGRALEVAKSKIARLEAEIARLCDLNDAFCGTIGRLGVELDRLRPAVVVGLSRGDVLAKAVRAGDWR